MHHRIKAAVELAALHALKKIRLVHKLGDIAIHEIAELIRTRKIVHRDDIGHSAVIERPHEIGSDKAGCAGHNNITSHG